MAADANAAQVAELVDALASGASGRKVVEVRVFSWAPLSVKNFSFRSLLFLRVARRLRNERRIT